MAMVLLAPCQLNELNALNRHINKKKWLIKKL